MKAFRLYIAWLCLVTCTTIIFPKELLHALAGHEDTVDHPIHQEEPDPHHHFDQQHIHCAIWQLEVLPNMTTPLPPLVQHQTIETTYHYSTGRIFLPLFPFSHYLRATPLV